MDDDINTINQACENLAAAGFLRDTGKRRGGHICWKITELGKRASATGLMGVMPAAEVARLLHNADRKR